MRSALLLGLAAAAAMSTKLTGILVAGPAFAHVAVGGWGRGERGVKEVAAFFAAALAVVVALNDLAAATLVNEARDRLFREIECRETRAA